jgi:RHS repeat-associated protein
VEGGPLPLVFTRYYRGHSDRYGELGYRWSHTFDTFLAVYSGGDAAVVFGSGKEEFFHWSNNAFAPLDIRIKSTLTTYANPPDGVDYRYKTKDGLTYNFAGDGDLISVEDANHNTIVLYRDPSTGRVTSVADPGGRSLALAYDGNGRLSTVTGPDGAVVTYTYDANGDLVAVDKPEDGRSEYAYSKHRLTQVKQRQGDDLASSSMVTVLTNTLDDGNRVIEQTDAAGKTTGIDYLTGDDQGITRVTDPLTQVTAFYFDQYARTYYVDYPGDESKTFVFDGDGNLQKTVDASDHQTQFAYDANADATTLTDPLGNPTNLTYNAKHLPLSVTDGNNHEWSFTYDLQGNVLTKTDPLNHTWTYTYDAHGNRLTETTPLDRTTIYTYDTGNNLTSKTDPLGHTWTYTYNGRGRKLTETDPNDHTTTWTWDHADRITAMQDATGATWSYSYDLIGEMMTAKDPANKMTIWLYVGAVGQVNGRTDTLGNTSTYQYDDNGRMISAVDPLGHAAGYTYDANGRLASQTVDPNPTGQTGHLNIVTAYAYDEAGRLATETLDPGSSPHLNRITTYAYDEAGHLTGKQLPNGGVWTYGFDDAGNQIVITNPLNHTTTYDYDAADRLVLETDPLGHRTKYVYDDDNRQTALVVDPATAPDGTLYGGSHLDLTTTTAYDAADRVTSVTDPLGHVTAYGYDDTGNQISVTVDPGTSPHLNETTWFEYDALNRVVLITDPLGRTTTYTYDSRGRKTQEIRGATATAAGIKTGYTYDDLDRLLTVTVDPGTSPHLNNVTSYTYDTAGRRTAMTNPRGKTTTYSYDAANRVTGIADALSGTVAFAYDAAGETTSVTNPRGKATTSTYDGLGNVLTETDPLSRTRTNVYDLAGQPTRQTDARGIETNYFYDAAGRLTNVQDHAGANLVTYAYDVANRQTGMTDETGATGWVYDDASRLTSVSSPQGTIGYTYDAANRRATMTLPGSRTVTYGYDAAGQLSGVTDWQSRTTTISYTGFGAVETVGRPNGVSSLYQYDGGGRLSAVEHDTASTMLARFAYDVDRDGNRTALHVTGTAVTNGIEGYTYDDLDRLTAATYIGGGTASYAYDANGNRLSVTSGSQTTTYSYDDADQLTSLSGATSLTFTYDLNGNRIAAGSDTFAYDWKDRLTEATVGGTTVDYTYTGDDLRATRRANGGTATPYLWDRQAGLPEIVDDGTTAYVQLDDPGLVEEVATSNADTYPLADALGSTRLRTDGTGVVVGTSDYDAFGNSRAASGTQGTLGWDGELRDPATGITYLRARDVDPLTGRFLQRDAVQPNAPGTQGYDAYAFAADNPVTHTDPTGHDVEIAMEVTAIVSLVDAYKGLASLVGKLGGLSPAARGLITAVLGFALGILRTIIVMLVMNLVIDAMGVLIKNSFIGRAITLLQQARVFRAAKAAIDACAETFVVCKLLPKLLPKLPCVAAAVVAQRATDAVLGEDTTTLDYAGAALTGLEACSSRGSDEGGQSGENAGDEGGTCMPNSFDAATLVLMADGSEKRIDQIAIADEVWAADPLTGEHGPRAVTAVIVGTGTKDLVDIAIQTEENHATITATANHPFWVASVKRWVVAAALTAGMALTTADGGSARVSATDSYSEPHRVYNLTVESLHTFFVAAGDENVLVHNAKRCLRTGNSKKLADNMTASGHPKPAGCIRCEPNHIVASDEPRLAVAAAHLRQFMDIDDASNGAWMPLSIHRSLKYWHYDAISKTILKQTNEQEIRAALQYLRVWLENGARLP